MYYMNKALLHAHVTEILNDLNVGQTTGPESSKVFVNLYGGIMPTYTEFNALTEADKIELFTIGTVLHPLLSSFGANEGRPNNFIVTGDVDSDGYSDSIVFNLFDTFRQLPLNTGLVTWFTVAYLSTTGTEPLYDTQKGFAVIGDVDVLGSGADLELRSPNLVLDTEITAYKVKLLFSKGIANA